MEPQFEKNDILMYYKYLNNAINYFEFGSGGSTYQALRRNNIQKVYSVESDVEWYNKVRKNIKSNKLFFLLVDLKCLPKNWGNPGKTSKQEDWIKYSNSILNLDINEANKLDLILIDGRFRVACCLKCFEVINNDCLIIFDDFLNRSQYHIVLDYFDIINSTKDKRMVILKKKQCLPPVTEIIKKYELIVG
jgi:hypothetical protein